MQRFVQIVELSVSPALFEGTSRAHLSGFVHILMLPYP